MQRQKQTKAATEDTAKARAQAQERKIVVQYLRFNEKEEKMKNKAANAA